MPNAEPLHLPVTELTGIGSQLAQRLEKLGITVLQDLLFHLPLRYEDRSQIHPIQNLRHGQSALICGRIEYTEQPQRGRSTIVCRIADATGVLNLRFFHFSIRQLQQLRPGLLIACYGEIRYGFNELEMVHPDYKIIEHTHQVVEATLIPVYPSTEGLPQRTLRKAVHQAITICQETLALPDYLPAVFVEQFDKLSINQALTLLHQPPADFPFTALNDAHFPALKRLAFEEFLAHHLALLSTKTSYQNWNAPYLPTDEQLKRRFLDQLPFNLTKAQQRVLTEIEQDCQSNTPMLRLVQGDVGSGKTVLAALNALLALSNGYQVALMAPTELLAEQHYANFTRWFTGFDWPVVFLSGQIKGKQRQINLELLGQKKPVIAIGTHALFQESVSFDKLGLVIIDEQHRFGVHQRQALRDKGKTETSRPHQLIMTATPIPRTLAMLNYADLDISIIDELPPGRKPISTHVLNNDKRQQVIARISDWVSQGHQVYWVCPLIEESETLQCEAAETTAITLSEQLPAIKVCLLHGRMKAAEKDLIMQAFKRGDYDLMVATTVIEVGVDVPNASLMVIENAERLGLSQLHQLRGRVGRGSSDSYCLLLYQTPLSAIGRERLGIIKQHQDGFIIAEQDLALRGPGELMGTRQTGQLQFKIARLDRDQALLEQIPTAARLIMQDHPEAVAPLIQRWIGEQRQNYQETA